MSIDKEVGVLVNKTDDEIAEVIKNKASNSNKLTDWDLKRIQDIYLNDELLKRKAKLLQTENKNEVKN